MRKIWIDAVVVLAFCLAGCSTTQDELLGGNETMSDIWSRETGNARQMQDARMTLRRPLTEAGRAEAVRDNAHYTRTAQNEIRRLPNPELVLYVFPHLAGSDPVPVPGYSTVFPLYRRAPYALPGERIEEY